MDVSDRPVNKWIVHAVIVIGLLPSLLTGWVLWLAPLNGLEADRTAMAARDYTALWAAGKIALSRQFDLLADPAGFTAYIRAFFGPAMPAQIWPYPPLILLIAGAAAALPFLTGYVLYALGSLLAFAVSLVAGRLSAGSTAAVLLSPAVAANLLTGQNGTLIATFAAGGLFLVNRQPVVAGLLFGLLAMKPQFALLLPICLLAGKRWTCLIAAGLSTLAFTGLSLLAFGTEPWVEFLSSNHAVVTAHVGAAWEASPAQSIFSSVFMAARSLGASLAFAYCCQAAVAIATAVIAWHLWSIESVCKRHRIAATLALMLIAAPWVHNYDMPALALAVVLMIGDQIGWRRALLGFAWLWPGLSPIVSIPPFISILSVMGVAWLATNSARRASALPLSA